MKKSTLLMVLSLVLALALGVGGTMAYLQDEDSDVNVMTLGKVTIDQLEKERIEQSDDNTADTNLKFFENDKPLYPYVGDLDWNDEYQNWPTGGANQLFTSDVKNVVDKFVFVENTGESDAYVRTWFAFEQGDLTAEKFDELIGININMTHWQWETVANNVEIDGGKYQIVVATYLGNVGENKDHPDGKLPAEETTRPSLLQVYLNKTAGNDDVEALDSNGNGKYDILVVSQAIQTMGFENADEALAAFIATNDNTEDEVDDLVDDFANYDLALMSWFGAAIEKYEEELEAEEQAKLWDTWDGTSDIYWYDPANPQTEYELTTAEQLAGLADLVSGDVTFDGVTFTLGINMDLYCEDTTESADGDPLTFRPIGDKSKNGTFEGVFDGNDKIIKNLYQNGWDLGYEWGIYGSYGLFGNLNDATVKNLTLTGGESYIEGGDVSFVAGSATGDCVFENITVEDSVAATYNNGCGGIIGWSGAGNYTFKNITLAEDTVLAGLWGSFDSSIGGIVGQGEPGATYNFENVDIACRIDAYNDCTASYDYYNYRMCGMIIGRLEETTTIDGSNYPDTSKYNINCNNVTVTYGDWHNYHYCRAEGARAIRMEAGYAYGGIAADYDHSVCTVHHEELIPFDQVFGGDQYDVKGLKSYEGVNVVYP